MRLATRDYRSSGDLEKSYAHFDINFFLKLMFFTGTGW